MSEQPLLRSNALQARSRAIVKTLVYRFLMILVTIMVALIVTGQVNQALSIGIVANVIKTGTYYVHERAWDRLDWAVHG